jgi:hypothetical protein
MGSPDFTDAMRESQSIEQAIQTLKKHGYFPVLLHVSDVQELREDLTDEQAMKVLEYADRKIADWGMCLDDVECALDELYGDNAGE